MALFPAHAAKSAPAPNSSATLSLSGLVRRIFASSGFESGRKRNAGLIFRGTGFLGYAPGRDLISAFSRTAACRWPLLATASIARSTRSVVVTCLRKEASLHKRNTSGRKNRVEDAVGSRARRDAWSGRMNAGRKTNLPRKGIARIAFSPSPLTRAHHRPALAGTESAPAPGTINRTSCAGSSRRARAPLRRRCRRWTLR